MWIMLWQILSKNHWQLTAFIEEVFFFNEKNRFYFTSEYSKWGKNYKFLIGINLTLRTLRHLAWMYKGEFGFHESLKLKKNISQHFSTIFQLSDFIQKWLNWTIFGTKFVEAYFFIAQQMIIRFFSIRAALVKEVKYQIFINVNIKSILR